MGDRFKATKGLLWYPLSDLLWVAVIPNRVSTEKCLLLGPDEAALLGRLAAPSGLQEEGLSPADRERLDRWAAPEFGVAEKRESGRPPDPYAGLAFAVFQEYESARGLDVNHDPAAYHRNEIKDSFRQFENVEMTVSHIYRDPHPALHQMSYGARFSRILLEEGAVGDRSEVLEVGCGTGIFGREFLNEIRSAAPGSYRGMRYTFFDISPVLSASQEEINREHEKIVSFQSGDASTHSFGKERYDLILANEMIADLPVVKVKREGRTGEDAQDKGKALARRLGLDLSESPPEFLLNAGALQFMITLSEALKAGGRAYVVEYGDPSGYPVRYHITNHREYSIHFGHLLAAAGRLGLDARLVTLPEFLGLDGHVEVLDDLSHHALFGHLLPFLGIKTEPSAVYTRAMLAKAFPRLAARVNNLTFVPLSSLDGIVYPRKFYVLRLVKPAPVSSPHESRKAHQTGSEE